ncbi:MAG: pullulanase, partial [Thermoprotei archaeon]
MAYILSRYPSVKVTFTFSGSLLSQMLGYLKGYQDYRQVLSWKIANGEKLTLNEKVDMLRIPGGFFDISWARIVNVVPKYSSLRDKAQRAFSQCKALPEEELKRCITERFSEQDFIDLATLFNLFWIDPEVLRDLYPELYRIRETALRNPEITFSRSKLAEILRTHVDIIRRTIQLYRDLALRNQVELIPVPYSHPLAPIMIGFGWVEDLKLHVIKGVELLENVFNYTPVGVWPAEQAVNQQVLDIFAKEGLLWTVTDKSILLKSIKEAKFYDTYNVWYVPYGEKRRFYVFFRDTELSDLIGFQYKTWDPELAAGDLIRRIVEIDRRDEKSSVVVIALDGENPWEHYEEFGDKFLNTLYSKLSDYQRRGLIITITPKEYIKLVKEGKVDAYELPERKFAYLDLSGRDLSDVPMDYLKDGYDQLPRKTVKARIAEGSWSGGELITWIGQREENAGWMMLAKAREEILKINKAKTLEDLARSNPEALEYLLRAEASDWWFWWGGEWGLGLPPNRLFKGFLAKAYKISGANPPPYLRVSLSPLALPAFTLNVKSPKPPEKPVLIDGILSGEEWKGSLNVSMAKASTLVMLTSDTLFIAIVPKKLNLWDKELEVAIYTTTPRRSVSPYKPGYNVYPRYGDKDLGMGLFYEVLVRPSEGLAVINAADGKGGWIELFRTPALPIAVRDVVELAVPLYMIALQPGDVAYLTATIYVNKSMIETATKLGGSYKMVIPRPTMEIVGAKTTFEISDPLGDDRGLGTYTYPKADVFKPGVFDLVRFRVLNAGKKVIFEAYVKELGGNPWNGPNGFSMQYIQIYIRTKLRIPGRTDTIGLNIKIYKDSAWHMALLLAPGWGSDPVPKGERAAIYYYNDTVIAQGNGFAVYADPARNAIIAEIDRD